MMSSPRTPFLHERPAVRCKLLALLQSRDICTRFLSLISNSLRAGSGGLHLKLTLTSPLTPLLTGLRSMNLEFAQGVCSFLIVKQCVKNFQFLLNGLVPVLYVQLLVNLPMCCVISSRLIAGEDLTMRATTADTYWNGYLLLC